MNVTEVTFFEGTYTFECPNCGNMIMVHKDDVGCAIFRHGQFRKDGSQINPHAPEEYCIAMARKKLIYGCGKPFMLTNRGNIFTHAVECDYI